MVNELSQHCLSYPHALISLLFPLVFEPVSGFHFIPLICLFPSQDFNRHCKKEKGKWKSTIKYFQIEWHGNSEMGERFLVGVVRKNLMERAAFKTKLE